MLSVICRANIRLDPFLSDTGEHTNIFPDDPDLSVGAYKSLIQLTKTFFSFLFSDM
jgi:hypothetical protein